MNYPTEARKVLKEFLEKAFRYENREMILLSTKCNVVSKNLESMIEKLSKEEVLSADKLYKLDLYKDILVISNKQVTDFNKLALQTVIESQEKFARFGFGISQKSIELVTVNFNHINIRAVNNMIGLARDGSPLYKLFEKSYPESVARLTNTLITSTAMGYNPQKTALLLAQDMNGNLSRALTIARTKQMNILRQSSIEQMKQSGVCKGWIRIEQHDACEDCQAENGKKYKFEDEFDTHPNCRGASIPDI